MIMNSNLREELTQLLADHLTLAESKRIIGGDKPATAWDRWLKVAEDAMEFIYGDEAPENVEPDYRSDSPGNTCGGSRFGGVARISRDDLVDDTGGMGPVLVEGTHGRLTVTGVFSPPKPSETLQDRLTIRSVPTCEVDLQLLSEALGPVRGSDDERSVRPAPEPEREAE